MADFTKTKKTKNYVKGSAKLVQFPSGGELINLDVRLEDLQKLPVNKNGYVKLVLGKLEKTDAYGNDYSIYENDFVPDKNKATAPRVAASVPSTKPNSNGTTDDMPF